MIPALIYALNGEPKSNRWKKQLPGGCFEVRHDAAPLSDRCYFCLNTNNSAIPMIIRGISTDRK